MSQVTHDTARTRKAVWAWGLWDWGSAAFNAVIVTFIFSVYLVDAVGADLPNATSSFSWVIAGAGFFIAVLAPVTGQQADAGGHRRRSLAMFTALVVLCMAALFFVRDEQSFFWFGALLIGVGTVFFEIGSVSYNAMLRQISTPATVGRVSGFGWAMGYFGGIFLLLFCYYGFVSGDGDTRGFLGLATEGGFNIRMVAVMSAIWFALFALPVLFTVPEIRVDKAQKVPWSAAYRKLFRDIADIFRTDRQLGFFLLASAVFRDGLAAVFTFGAILAVSVYEISAGDVLIFGVAANIVSALGALAAGWLDDWWGPRTVIVFSLVGLIISGTTLVFVSGPAMFWIFGLLLCLFVGPAQSASRTFVLRLAPPGREGQIFGLYATTGRAVSFLAPALFGFFVTVTGEQDRYGTIGIVIVLLTGLILMAWAGKPVDKALTDSADPRTTKA